jgi:aspartate/methionine/tyrosine aminotransferase
MTLTLCTATLRRDTGCEPEGALYAFPRLRLPDGAIAAAEKMGKDPDFLYCMELLKSTGIVAVPGSGFKQVRSLVW